MKNTANNQLALITFFRELIRQLSRKTLPRGMYNALKKKFAPKYVFHRNINRDLTNPHQKKVLISYIAPVLDEYIDYFWQHTNSLEALQIIKTFIDLDYAVDIINCTDEKNADHLRQNYYDCIFGELGVYYEACLRNPNAIKIAYLTGGSEDFSALKERERIEYFYARHPDKRHIDFSEFSRVDVFSKKNLAVSSYAISLGNDYTVKLYFPEFTGRIFTMSPTAHINQSYQHGMRNFENSKKNFVWFASGGALHKGLDLLIDVFRKQSDCVLHICGLTAREKPIFFVKSPNIKYYGFVPVQSEQFLQIVQQSSFVIMPSCSEGKSTAVLTCMNHGLLPIVTRECGIDVFDFGFYLENYQVEYIADVIRMCSCLDNLKIAKMHDRAFEYARNNFSLDLYTKDLKLIISKIINEEGYHCGAKGHENG